MSPTWLSPYFSYYMNLNFRLACREDRNIKTLHRCWVINDNILAAFWIISAFDNQLDCIYISSDTIDSIIGGKTKSRKVVDVLGCLWCIQYCWILFWYFIILVSTLLFHQNGIFNLVHGSYQTQWFHNHIQNDNFAIFHSSQREIRKVISLFFYSHL